MTYTPISMMALLDNSGLKAFSITPFLKLSYRPEY